MNYDFDIQISILKSIVGDGSYNFTFTFTGKQSVLKSVFFPPLELPKDKSFVTGLVDLYTYYSIPNVYSGCDKIYIGGKTFEIPTGSYEIDELEKNLKEILAKHKITLNLKANNSTLTCDITCNEVIDLKKTIQSIKFSVSKK